ncbi:hypothetical protein [Microbulbifer taiwanensis]|uniref:hypothetical protein n=1 Tax=Microbulbifer taiwanensis TaxID=986746 RepID=UPI00362089DF
MTAADCGAYSVAIEVKAELTAEALERWQLDTYRAIAAGCEQQRQRYYDTLSGWPGNRKKLPSWACAKQCARNYAGI